MAPAPAFRALPLGAVRPLGWLRAQLRRDLDSGFAARLDRLTAHAAHDLFRERIPSSGNPRAWWDAETRGNWLWGYVMMAHLAGVPEHQARGRRPDGRTAGHAGRRRLPRHLRAGRALPARRRRERRAVGAEPGPAAADRPLRGHRRAGVLAAMRRAVDLTLQPTPATGPTSGAAIASLRDPLTGLTHGLCYLDVLEWLHDARSDPAYAQAGIRFYESSPRMPRRSPTTISPCPTCGARPLSAATPCTRPSICARCSGCTRSRPTECRFGRRHRVPAPAPLPPAERRAARRREHPRHADAGSRLRVLHAHRAGVQPRAAPCRRWGRADLGDWLETLVFNAVQGARLPDGRAIAYLSADTRLPATADRPTHSAGATGPAVQVLAHAR